MLIVGKILLMIVCILLLLFLLFLFFPFRYFVKGGKNAESWYVKVKITWLFRLVRFMYQIPLPGKAQLKVGFFTVYRFEEKKKNNKKEKSHQKRKKKKNCCKKRTKENTLSEKNVLSKESQVDVGAVPKLVDNQKSAEKASYEKTTKEKPSFFYKVKKIKYTILGLYDKIKNIFNDIIFYRELLQKEETQELFSYGLMRLKKIFGYIKPRRIKADFAVGTGAPDTTGYLWACYAMIMPWFGKHDEIQVIPDFERAILEGDFEVKGYFTVFHIMLQVILVMSDKRLHKLMEIIRNHDNEKK